jgi:hypothetical protein
MSAGGVYGDDMEDLPDFDDPALSELLGDVRSAYRSQLPASLALAELFDAVPKAHRSASMRRVLAQLVAATTVVVAATGGLAVAGALPAPVQNVVSSAADGVGVDVPQGDDATPPGAAADDTTTTTVDEPNTTSPTTDAVDESSDDSEGDDAADVSTGADNHGAEVSAVAHDKTLHGCEHGRAVSSVASGKVKDKPCPHADEDAAATTPTTTATEVPEVQPTPEPTTVPESGATQSKKSKPARGNSNGRHGHAKHGG